ncbi:2-SUCCINYL-5-ENOLPYRUVYL-6-HYDROXY-3-CYCLOHEXENE-1-CARBOXYLATE SYNTHASE [Salix koriyanagi]|uniref:2-SUCCINYL-5-ENOLPYRUVYL-6-HYDROXY-3-CYCLOHEXENE-1-CARBOXYLATE SYNTHASE n=1 Tax=Salix koriyanagi TaxID=2511006 RepID=A0A9Q1AHY5_9ROSI|nr:2-SUCCINYL-5-ENOLPYRUVYL-6-HYDROXY-3-CYCLOHEXENE-1-CARBOXYLATE SYNTHASE [Salix koriyanagi]
MLPAVISFQKCLETNILPAPVSYRSKNPPIQAAMKPHILLLTSNIPLPSLNLPFRKRKSLPLAFLNRNTSIHFPRFQNPKFKAFEAVRFDCPVTDVTELEGEDCNLVLETCITRALPPALTLERGIESIKAAVVGLKSNPPCSSHGVFRFQVAVPPSPKALNWFCSLPESDGVFPRFFLSKETEDASFKNLYLHRTRGVFGLGSAICFEACAPENQKRIRRYLSSDSAHIMTYGFMDIKFNKESSSIKHEAGSFCFLIPEVELDEQEEASILVVTLAWDENFCWTFEQAIQSIESSIYQASCCFWPDTESCYSKCIKSTLRNFNLMEGQTFQMACTDALFLDRRDYQADTVELRRTKFSTQFCFRLSPVVGVSSNMLDDANETSYSLQDQANINAVWASLIVEECSRLGIVYFCVAPGSRSSPLAIAASTHPLTTFIITSSGTAVSNLLPAVVEASQDFVPLLLLTADRPPELLDAGANQAINQVNHFGSFVRFTFSLPAPTIIFPARMVLTTIDSAVHWATSLPFGPVHINCPFGEPLDDSSDNWMLSCLKRIGYLDVQGLIQGLLLLGAIHTEDEIWAALLLAKHLNWPVVADILSGLRLRKLLPSLPEIEENVLFVDHLDHALLSEGVGGWIHFDVIVQIGSRITSKRVSQMVEDCFPCTYILVDNHPCRHDPSHFVTHRVQCSIRRVARDISFQINAEYSITEPHVAHVITEALSAESALFVGNSMIIRDADMYGRSCKTHAQSVAHMMLDSELPCLSIRVAGNRGASGIDGLLSTAIGFAVGCNKQVLCLVGDVSMLHDTNGLAILTQRVSRKPMRILVINNHESQFKKLCEAHGVRHLPVKTKVELQEALLKFEHEKTDCVIEVESCIGANSTFHSTLRKSAQQAADHALSILSRLSVGVSISDGLFLYKIHKMNFSLYRIQLCAPPTSSSADHHHNEFHREGYILSVYLEDGSVGYGEVAPLEIHKENLVDVEEQLLFLLHIIKGIKIDVSLPTLKGSFTSWIWSNLGITECSIFPSVRCGLEMAILNAIAVSQGSSFISMLQPQMINEEIYEKSSVKICALVDSNGTPNEVAYIASSLVEEGFTAIKLKVARRADPIQDAAVICKVRNEVGPCVELRVDANRKWTYEEAIQFGFRVKDCDLQYIEEPVENVDDIVKFCEETGLPAALDETIDNFQESHLNMLAKYTHPGIVAVVSGAEYSLFLDHPSCGSRDTGSLALLR